MKWCNQIFTVIDSHSKYKCCLINLNEMNFTFSNVILIVQMEMMPFLHVQYCTHYCFHYPLSFCSRLSILFRHYWLYFHPTSFMFAFVLFCFVSPGIIFTHFASTLSRISMCGCNFFLSQTNSNRMVVINTKLCFSFRNRLVNHGNCILCIRWLCLTHQQTFS